MPASALNMLQAVRRHYGLGFAPLAACLGVSEALLKLAATDRRELPTAAYLRLRPLAEALPPTWNEGLPLPTPPLPALPPLPPLLALPAPDAVALRARLAELRHRLLALERTLAPAHRRVAQAEALRAVLPALAAAQPPADARAAQWLPLLHAQVAERLGPAAGAALALGEARRLGLRTEAAQLLAWLGADPANQPITAADEYSNTEQ